MKLKSELGFELKKFSHLFYVNRIILNFCRFFYLYKISYMWYAPIGFCIAFFGGWIISQILILLKLEGDSTIYMDESKTLIHADLFSPPIAKRLRIQNAKILERNYSVSLVLLNLYYSASFQNSFQVNGNGNGDGEIKYENSTHL